VSVVEPRARLDYHRGVQPEQAFTRRGQVAVGAVEAFVAEAGDPDGAPIVLLHGNPDTHAVWTEVVARLPPSYRCIAPDLPGFGASRAPADFDFALPHQGAFLAELLDALALERVHLVIHDIGAAFGVAFATGHADRVRTLTIFNASMFPHHFWARVWKTRVLGELAMALSNRRLFVGQIRRGSPRMPLEYAHHAYAQFTKPTRRMALRWYRAMRHEDDGWDTRFRDATAAIPRQVIWGDLDPFIPIAIADRYGAPVRHVADCGHWVMAEDAELAATAITELVTARAT
jgi:pimeloyl-ACP methyl ester carboxylesterase